MSFENGGSSSGGRCYVDNYFNRKHGRVGMPLGSMVISSGGSPSPLSSGFVGLRNCLEVPVERLYVDNAFNRAVGRAGMPLGSMVISNRDSRPSSSSSNRLCFSTFSGENSGSERSYVDNAFNMALGRDDMPLGSMVVSNRDSRPSSSSFNIQDILQNGHSADSENCMLFVDNCCDKTLDKYGMPLGTMVEPNRESRPSSLISNVQGFLQNGYGLDSETCRSFIDKCLDKTPDRNGIPLGSTDVSSGESGHFLTSPSFQNLVSAINDEYRDKGTFYVDDSHNRTLGRDGMPLGSMVASHGSRKPSSEPPNITGSSLSAVTGENSSSERSYVDNPYNRALGRVGMPVGSMVVSSRENRQSTTGSNFPEFSSSAVSGENRNSGRSCVDNSYNNTLDKFSMQLGSVVVSSEESNPSSTSSNISNLSFPINSNENIDSRRTYVDNSYNRTMGRVGMPLGSKKVSVGKDRPSSACASSSGKYGGDSDTSGRSYVDNSYNRALGRVGMPLGSKKVFSGKSRPSTASASLFNSSTAENRRTYVDNAQDQKLERVGKPVGSMPVSRSKRSSGPKTYVDNEYNRKHDRVGMEHGSKVVSKSSSEKSSSRASKINVEKADISYGVCADVGEVRVYKDNAFNRRLGRVGKPVGTAVQSKSGQTEYKVYADNAENRRSRRVGFPRGSRPKSLLSGTKCSKKTEWIHLVYQRYRENPEAEIQYRDLPALSEEMEVDAIEKIMDLRNRLQFEKEWREKSKTKYVPKTDGALLHYTGPIIKYSDLEIGKPIGRGGFGVVFYAMYKGSVVAVKKLHVTRVTKGLLKEFNEEINILNRLEHPYIVKFIGACITVTNLCIVMEYLQMSLYDALHVDRADLGDFTDEDRLNMIKQTLSGLKYLHGKNVAHCDIKSGNILIDHDGEKFTVAKLSDFGISMMKNESETSLLSSHESVRNAGTPRYSSPEILRGEFLNLNQMKMSDMYSYALVVYEIIVEIEPFASLSFAQLRNQVGRKGLYPQFPEDIHPDVDLEAQLLACWDRNPTNRPTARSFLRVVNRLSCVYELETSDDSEL